MKSVSLEEFGEIVSEAKAGILDIAEESGAEITVTIEGREHEYDDHAVTVTDDGIYVPIACDLGTSTDIRVVDADIDGEMLAAVLAVLSDALSIELDGESFILPEGSDEEAIFTQAEWCLTNGLR